MNSQNVLYFATGQEKGKKTPKVKQACVRAAVHGLLCAGEQLEVKREHGSGKDSCCELGFGMCEIRSGKLLKILHQEIIN